MSLKKIWVIFKIRADPQAVHKRRSHSSVGNRTRVVQPVASSYTDCAIPRLPVIHRDGTELGPTFPSFVICQASNPSSVYFITVVINFGAEEITFV
jgi:hypothetical protein